jgi:hypothetical protein
VERAPTAFGAVSFQARSLLSKGEVLVTVDAPPRRPAKLLVRPPLPAGWGVVGADVAGTALTPGAEGAVDVAGRPGRFLVRFRVARKEL